MKRTILISAILLAASCSYDDMRLQKPQELGTTVDECIIEAEGGVAEIGIYTNMAGTSLFDKEVSWARIQNGSFAEDAVVKVNVDPNEGRARMVKMIVQTQARKDTVSIKQKGAYEEYFILPSNSIVAYNGQGETSAAVETNVDTDLLDQRTVYLDAGVEPWIESVKVADGNIVLTTKDNTDAKEVRRAIISFTYTDGWEESQYHELRVTQANAANKIGNQLSFEELRAMAQESPLILEDDYTIEGYIVSDIKTGNAGENTQMTSTTIDYTMCKRTAYMESKDGALGLMLEFATEEDYIVAMNTLVTINLEGAQLTMLNNPERYVVSGIRSSRVISCEAVSPSDIPVKIRKISQLTDADIYTRVTLTDCEFPVRKGSLTPVTEGYTLVWGFHRATKFPTLIRDIEGSSMYMYTNTTCTYRRDGSCLGYGSGNVTGVIVHEKYRSFIDKDAENEEECGNIGRYQLRHFSREDLAFNKEFKDGFSEMICEWRYMTTGNSEHGWEATYGRGTMNHSYEGSVNSVYNTHAYPVYEYSYLGPCEKNDSAPNINGFGIILEDGTDYGKDYTGTVAKGVLSANNTIALAWMREQWWDSNRNGADWWEVKFSTKGISTDKLSMQISVFNPSQEGKSPNQWKAEWSVNGTSWTHIADYSVPDVVLWTVTQPWQSAGYKPIDIPLPLEMLDKDNVYIRLMPRNRLGSTPQGYLDAEYINGSAGSSSKANSAMNYFAIRYNK